MYRSCTIQLLIRISSLLFLAQCSGYHIYEKEASCQPLTISVPYFSGDQDGMLTSAIIKQLCTSPTFEYRNHGGTLVLRGSIIDDKNAYVGYQYDRQSNSGAVINRLVPNEGRRTITVRISLVNGLSQRVLHGPFDLSASNDYDFLDASSPSFMGNMEEPQSALFFSLGQLHSEQGAYETSSLPIYERLARKIVESIVQPSLTQIQRSP